MIVSTQRRRRVSAPRTTFSSTGGRVALHLRDETVIPPVGVSLAVGAERYNHRFILHIGGGPSF